MWRVEWTKVNGTKSDTAVMEKRYGMAFALGQNMLGHESAALTLDRYGHLFESDVEAVGVAMNALLTRGCGQNVVTGAA